MRSGAIKNTQITVSSTLNKYFAANLGRLGQIKRGQYKGAWCARHNNHNQWFKVEFSQIMKITKIDTQGRQDAGHWVTKYQFSSSLDGIHWSLFRYMSNDVVSRATFYHNIPTIESRAIRKQSMQIRLKLLSNELFLFDNVKLNGLVFYNLAGPSFGWKCFNNH